MTNAQSQMRHRFAIRHSSFVIRHSSFVKDDVRSSYFLESVATEFDVQGLELDWTCIAWDADFRCRRTDRFWDQFTFRGSRWERIQQAEHRAYHISAYRFLLSRARQGMVIVVPHGASDDHTRQPGFYGNTYAYLQWVGMKAGVEISYCWIALPNH